MKNDLIFEKLVSAIQQVHQPFSIRATRTINIRLTLRNWMTELYINEYEQNGSDHAQYRKYLLDN